MKYILLLPVFSLLASGIQAQQVSYPLRFTFGWEPGVHGTLYESTYLNTTLETDTGAALTSMFQVGAQYHLHRYVSAGISASFGSYIPDPENELATANNIRVFQADIRLHPVLSDRFNWYLQGVFGFSSLLIDERTTLIIPIEYTYEYRGGLWGLGSGIQGYLTEHLGLFFQLQYVQHSFNMTNFYLNGDIQNIDGFDNSLQTLGLQTSLGITLRL